MSAVKPEDILENKSVKNLGRYLRDLRVLLRAYEVIDRVGKARNESDFVEAVSMAMRLSENLEAEANRRNVNVFIPSERDLDGIIKLAAQGPEALKLVSRYLYAFAYTWAGQAREVSESEEGDEG